eukprot:TRINITY_DN24934_c0_g1_i1.p2 TRINITY_DN24934_c0_g1~~TRINITY_DN24934_c0_g1_i1.p2  ORF type:complete len:231 (-),score=62.39 TRINITY_DN24934_c0_g1_i1:196-888(-)
MQKMGTTSFVNGFSASEWMPADDASGGVSMGTTIMAVEFDGGVVMGADSRTTTGAYIANRVTDKITPVHDRIYCCRSGSAADTQAVADYVKYYLDLHTTELGEPPEVSTAARMFQQLCYSNKNMLMAGIICAGWDRHHGGRVFSINLGGSNVRQPFTIGGSGSSYIYGYCDAHYKTGMTRLECIQFTANAVALAMARDGSSGGVVRLAIIDKDGVERVMIPGDKLPKFFV